MNSGKNTILIIDDDKMNLMMLSRILNPKYEVMATKNGFSGMQIAKEKVPDLIILDIIMPEIDGYEVCIKLKEDDVTKEIPIIFITGLNSIEDEKKGLALGAVDYINRPFIPQIVELRIENQIKIVNQQRYIREIEFAEQACQIRGEFTSRMSHEMRTPMNAILGMSYLALNAKDIEKNKYWLTKVINSARNFLLLVDNILDLPEIESQSLTLHNRLFDFRKTIHNIEDMVSLVISEKKQDFSLSIDEEIPRVIYGDEKRISQALLNLLSNAIKFTPLEGKVSVGIQLVKKEESKDTITIKVTVQDTGIGMSADEINRLFIPYEQLHYGVDRDYQGLGIGLPITKDIVRAMGGELKVESEKGKGSVISFDFVTKTAENQQSINVSEDLSNYTILLADDVEINREIFAALLDDSKINIDYATNGQEAIEKYIHNPHKYNMIFMDINMPVLSGIEATKQIRSIQTIGTSIPIIAYTANALSSNIIEYKYVGFTDHLAKPINFEDLMDILMKYLT